MVAAISGREIVLPPVSPYLTEQTILGGNYNQDISYSKFAGLTTYANLPYVHCLAPEGDEVEKFDIAILGAPFDTVCLVLSSHDKTAQTSTPHPAGAEVSCITIQCENPGSHSTAGSGSFQFMSPMRGVVWGHGVKDHAGSNRGAGTCATAVCGTSRVANPVQRRARLYTQNPKLNSGCKLRNSDCGYSMHAWLIMVQGVTARPGARFGPAGIRRGSRRIVAEAAWDVYTGAPSMNSMPITAYQDRFKKRTNF